MEYKDPGRYIPIKYLLYSWGSQFGFPVESLYYCNLGSPCSPVLLEKELINSNSNRISSSNDKSNTTEYASSEDPESHCLAKGG